MKIAAKLDAKVDSGKLVPYWRKFFKIRSIQWSLGGIFIALAQTFLLLGGVYQLKDWTGKAAFGLIMSVSFLGSMYGSLTRQHNLRSDDDDDTQHA